VSAALAILVLLWYLLGPLRSAVAAPDSGPAADPGRAAIEVFQDHDFWWKRIDSPKISTSWIEKVLTAIGEFLGRILTRLAEFIWDYLRGIFRLFGRAQSGGSIAVWGLVAALLVWTIWRIAPLIVRWLQSGARAPRAQERVASQALPEPSELFEQAGHALKNGAYAEAIRLALLALIARLEKQGLLRYDTTRTNREYESELGPRADLAARFGQLARIYERAWYGRMSPSASEAETAINVSGSIIYKEDLAPE
jgi:hypothetical protein